MSDFTLNINAHINYAIRNFDFKRVQDTMALMDWKWALNDGYRVPTIEEMKSVAKDLLLDLCNSDFTNSATGGFVAIKYDDYLELSFVITELATDIINSGMKYERLKKSKERIKKIEKINNAIND